MDRETLERLVQERNLLRERMDKLEAFIQMSDVYQNLTLIDRILLKNQLDAMIRYYEVLSIRIERGRENGN